MNPILKYFHYEHLPERLQVISKPFHELAFMLNGILPEGPEKMPDCASWWKRRTAPSGRISDKPSSLP